MPFCPFHFPSHQCMTWIHCVFRNSHALLLVFLGISEIGDSFTTTTTKIIANKVDLIFPLQISAPIDLCWFPGFTILSFLKVSKRLSQQRNLVSIILIFTFCMYLGICIILQNVKNILGLNYLAALPSSSILFYSVQSLRKL